MSKDFLPSTVKTKECKICKKIKPIDQFYRRGVNSPYRHGYCKECHTEPFRYERFFCPHCQKKIVMFGIDENGNVINKKSNILKKLRKEAVKKKNKNLKIEPVPVKSLKDVFDD